MTHPDRKTAKRYDNPGRCKAFTDAVYSGESNTPQNLFRVLNDCNHQFDPAENQFIPLIGDLHGHSNFSDGSIDPDEYYRRLKEDVKLDFAALTDHDHGGVGKPELWAGNPSKWDKIKALADKYCEPGKFTTILAYERDSYPFYNNMILYFDTHNADMVRGIRDGELTEEELTALLKRNDVVTAPHDTYYLSSGADLSHIPLELMTPLMEVISRGDAAEYMGNPAFDEAYCCEGGFLQDALRRGAEMGVIGGSDDHSGKGGTITEKEYPFNYPGLTGLWAKNNTLESVFEALKAKRTFAFMGGRMTIDFRINNHFMGEKFSRGKDGELHIWFSVSADAPVKSVTLVKNCRDYIIFNRINSNLVIDYNQETEKDCYYLRVELKDKRFGWTSPVWVTG